jgi:DNA-binding winged helix-turn-helix (wHTH) protein
MAWPGTQRELIRFGPFELVTRYHELRKRGIAIKHRLQPFAVLSMLVQREGQTIFRGEIHNTSGEASPSSAVSISRSTRFAQRLGTMRPRFIETIPRRGYRFIARWSTAAWENQSIPLH